MKKRSKISTLFRMLGLVKPLSGFMCLAVLCGTLAFLAVEAIPVLGVWGMFGGRGGKVWFWLTLFGLALGRAVLRFTEQRTNHYIAFTLLAIVRDRVFKALRKLCPAKLEGRDKGDLISLITSDVELLEVFYAHTISPICIAFICSVAMCVFLGMFHPLLAIYAAFAYITVGMILPMVMSRISGDTGEKLRIKAGGLSAFVLENIRGLDETLQYGCGQKRMDRMNGRTDDLTKDQGVLNKLMSLNAAVANSVIILLDAGMIALLLFIYGGSGELVNGAVALAAFVSSFGPVSALAALGTTLQNTIASGGRVLDIIDEQPETEDVTGQPAVSFTGAELNNVTFGYGGETVLKNVSVEFPENRIVGIVGKSGCGKSTMLKLLMRFWKTGSGEVRVSDRNIEQINTSDLRDMESYMTQETVLFKDTIANNIRIAKLGASDDEVVEACKKASLHEFIMSLPDGYETQVGELGETLSGGERQRIGLARAFLHDAPFLLLDEPTSNLDSLNEAVILKSLREGATGKTIALVSHRRSTVRIADEMIEM
ncbi:MAG TPA: ABC transporter ATP-binding protein [Ruminococcaceae bacterium]|nr:ABC transporter ATP-binding protein [Oscillospiraceae bacterium]